MSKWGSRNLVAIALAGLWINGNEFLRNEIWLKSHWIAHYHSLGRSFPSGPLQGAVWVLWGFVFAAALCAISQRWSLLSSTLLGWVLAFVLMWLVTWNLGVLPESILPTALPLSLIETLGGVWICQRVASRIRG
jgi:hypothetical protein